MAGIEHDDARDAAIAREPMQMAMKSCRTCHLNAPIQRPLDVLNVIEITGAKQVQYKMGSCELLRDATITEDFTTLLECVRANRFVMIFLLGGA